MENNVTILRAVAEALDLDHPQHGNGERACLDLCIVGFFWMLRPAEYLYSSDDPMLLIKFIIFSLIQNSFSYGPETFADHFFSSLPSSTDVSQKWRSVYESSLPFSVQGLWLVTILAWCMRREQRPLPLSLDIGQRQVLAPNFDIPHLRDRNSIIVNHRFKSCDCSYCNVWSSAKKNFWVFLMVETTFQDWNSQIMLGAISSCLQ